MKKVLYTTLSMLLFLCCLPILAATLSAQLDRYSISPGETVNLQLSIDKRYSGTQPDLSALQKDFSIIATSTSQKIIVINSKVNENTVWNITLLPDTNLQGKVIIPAITLGSYKSKPLTLMIREAANSLQKLTNKDIFIQTSVNTEQPYKQQQVIYTVELYSRESLRNGSLNVNQASDVQIKPFGQEKNYSAIYNGRTYRVLERQYILFPQKSGKIKIAPPILNAVIPSNQMASMFNADPFFGIGAGRRVRIIGPALTLNIRPIPSSFKGNWWLPASNLQLTQTWSPKNPSFRVGDAITRIINISADGVTAEQLPDIDQSKISGMNVYPDKATTENHTTSVGINGIRQQKFAFIPTQAGKITLPAIKVPWWNIKKKRLEVAEVPSKTIKILPASSTKPVKSNLQNNIIATTSPTMANNKSKPFTLSAQQSKTSQTTVWPWVISALLLLVWLITLYAWWQQRHKTRTSASNKKQLEDIATINIKQALKDLRLACQDNQAKNTRLALIAFSKAKWPTQKYFDLVRISRHLKSKALKNEIENLNQALYSERDPIWNGRQFWEVFIDDVNKEPKKNASEKDALPNL